VSRFFFNGKAVDAQPGDTVASALYRAGRRIFTRSFKYHRARGLLCVSGRCPNCMMNVDGMPNVRTCVTPVREGMRVKHQNAYPSLDLDLLASAQAFDALMPVGWYYKTFTHPQAWHAAEPFIRKAAGLGEPPRPDAPRREYEHTFQQAEVTVVGGGPAGIAAALEAARRGAQVVLIDDQPEPGGHLRYSKAGGYAELAAELRGAANVEVLSRSYCFGVYEGGLLGIVQPEPHAGAYERLIHLRAKEIVVATGAYETPLPFENNDLPGVMLSSGVRRLLHVHGIMPGRRAAVIAQDGRGEELAAELRGEGIEVVEAVAPDAVTGAVGSTRVQGLRTSRRSFPCDLIAVCGHMVPDAGLLSQAGAKLRWSEAHGAFVPVDLPPHVRAVGRVTGEGLRPAAQIPPNDIRSSKRNFVCLCSDVTSRDLEDGIAEGFDQIETLKRYTTTTMGPCQGRMCQLGAIAVCARQTGREMDETGTTTARPPAPTVTLGSLAGPRHHPIRRTPMHYQHDALGAVWMDMGDWKRPRFYKTAASSAEKPCVEAEYRAVREQAGVIDVSTLGKLDVRGRDAGKLLDKVYTNRFSDLRTGRVRYSVICDESGIMLDDGTISRLAEDHYFLTTTTGNLDFVQQWLEWWSAGSGWDVHVTNLTGGLAAVNLAGPLARNVLSKLTDIDLSSQAFPYMACRRASVADIPAILLRIGFVGETGWEIHAPAESGEDLWEALLKAGKEFGIQPFGVEAQRLLRLEKRHVIVGVDTDALTSPYEADMAWTVKLDKADFIGKTALGRASQSTPKEKLVGFVMQEDGVPEDGSAVVADGRPAGRVTSSRFSPAKGRAIGLAWLAAERARDGEEVQIRVQGRPLRARVTEQPFYDPEGARLRT
jgi:sarcosine oxidase subunit alpha